MEIAEPQLVEEFGADSIWGSVERFEQYTDPTESEKPELTLDDDVRMALALCPGMKPKLVEIRPLNKKDLNPKKKAAELAHSVLSAHKAGDISAMEAACRQLRSFLLQHRIEVDIL